jgi:hypothetical protein
MRRLQLGVLGAMVGAVVGMGGVALPCFAQAGEQVSVSLVGLRIQNGQSPSRSSAPNIINPANNYTVTFSNVEARGTSGLLALLFPQATPIETILQTFDPTIVWDDSGDVPNPTGTHPFLLGERSSSGSSGGITGSLTLRSEITASNFFTFSITNVTLSPAFLVGAMEFTSGTVSVRRNPITCGDIDFDNNGLFPDDQDLIAFLTVLAGGPCPEATCDTIDFNGDGLFPSDEDLVAFLRVLAGGDC